MGSLGNIFEGDAAAGEEREPDIHIDLDVPPDALGDPGGYRAELPRMVPQVGERIERALVPGEDEVLELHLPAQLPEGAVLRLRRQGGVEPKGIPGDLYVRLRVSPDAPVSVAARAAAGQGMGPLLLWLAVLLAAAAGVGLLL